MGPRSNDGVETKMAAREGPTHLLGWHVVMRESQIRHRWPPTGAGWC